MTIRFFLIGICGWLGAQTALAGGSQPTIVVTTSMLERMALDLMPDEHRMRIERLLPPASCPGHFDLNPKALSTLRSADVVVRHSYQSGIEEKLRNLGARDLMIVALPTPGSLVIPDNYTSVASSLAEALGRRYPRQATGLRSSLARIRSRGKALAAEARSAAAALRAATVVASSNQAEFCRWLGFDVVQELPRPEDVSPRILERCFYAHPALIVGNLQEGGQAAEALAERLGVPVAMLSNFPGVDGYGMSHADLVRANVRRLVEAWRPSSSN
jgi:ABC-type Zn uptake system ZnuABC Zn-binding protein ZnuA